MTKSYQINISASLKVNEMQGSYRDTNRYILFDTKTQGYRRFSSKEAILKESMPLNTGVHLVYLLSEAQGEAPMNIIINGKYLLFDKWYREIRQKNYGPYFITSKWNSYLVNASGEVIKELGYFKIIVSDELYSVTNQNNSFQIYNNCYELIDSDFTSVMWSDGDIWGIHTLSSKSHKVYLYGEANEILTYAHEILISKNQLHSLRKKAFGIILINKVYFMNVLEITN